LTTEALGLLRGHGALARAGYLSRTSSFHPGRGREVLAGDLIDSV